MDTASRPIRSAAPRSSNAWSKPPVACSAPENRPDRPNYSNGQIQDVSPEFPGIPSSARAHLAGRDDRLVKVAPLLAMIADWNAFLQSAVPEEELRQIRRHGRTGRPLGDETFLGRLEGLVGRVLKPQKRGPKPKRRAN